LREHVPIQENKKNLQVLSAKASKLPSDHDHLVYEIVSNSDEIQI
jgi:hypothetical protein